MCTSAYDVKHFISIFVDNVCCLKDEAYNKVLFGKLRAVSSVLFVLLHAKRKLCRRTMKGEATSSNNRGCKPEKKKK